MPLIIISDPITDGVHAELIRSDSGLLLGIRVSWSWLSSDEINCFQSPVEVQLRISAISQQPIATRRRFNSINRNNSIEFDIADLVCNQMYVPRVMATYNGIGTYDDGNTIYFGGDRHFFLGIISDKFYAHSRFTEISTCNAPQSVCWTINNTTTSTGRQSQHLLGSSSLSPSEWSLCH